MLKENDVEISWFAPICDGDDDILGSRNPKYKSTWENTSNIIKTADELGYTNVLCPSSYQVGQDTLPFVSAMAPLTKQINFLAAIRCGEIHPPMLARTLATLDHILKGRLTVNIISSDLPGTKLESPSRYARSREVIEILKQAWTKDEIDFKGNFYNIKLPSAPVKPYQQNGGPLLYFGGYSPAALELCGQHCDVYLMWPEPKEQIAERMKAVNTVAERYNRTLDYGLRVHVIVRDTEAEAKEYAEHIVSKLDDEHGRKIRERALDSTSLGVSHQAKNRDIADDFGYVEPHLWTGVGRARSGCGAAIVGSADQVLSELEAYQKMGIRAFILSGYPHIDECKHFGTKVLPNMKTCSLPHAYGRVPSETPMTPLGPGVRK